MNIKLTLLCFMLFSIATTVSAWESHPVDPPNTYDENGDMHFNSEHVELTSQALTAAGAFTFIGNPLKPPIEVCGTTRDFNAASLKWKTLKDRVYCPANFAELPDFFHSMEDYINQKQNCPPLLAWDAKECHSFEHFMGALNSSHFPPQTKANYTQYHRIAQAIVKHSNDLHAKLLLADALPEYKDYWEQCRLEALTYESIGQHYLQDQWAMGHMWHRWGGPEVNDFELSGPFTVLNSFDRSKLIYGTIIGGISGMIHGWKSTVQPIWDSPNITEDALSFYRPGVNWVRVDLTGKNPDIPSMYPGSGDLFLNQEGNFVQQKYELAECTKEGFTQLEGFKENATEISPLCWNNYATNKAMNIGFNLSPSGPIFDGILNVAASTSDVGNVLVKGVQLELARISLLYSSAAIWHADSTFIAEGYTSVDRDKNKRLNLFSIKPNDEYNRIPSYMDPAKNAAGDPPDSEGVQPYNSLFGVRQVRYFNKCHANLYCENTKIVNDYRDSCRSSSNEYQEVDCQICEELAGRYFLGDTPLCGILSPGINPELESDKRPNTKEEVKTWCREIETDDTPEPPPIEDSDYPLVYSGPAVYKQSLAITWDGGDTVECESTGNWTVTLREDGSATVLGEYTVKPSFSGGDAYCNEKASGNYSKFNIGTHLNGKLTIDILLDNNKSTLMGDYSENSLTADYSNTRTGILAGWGEMTQSESLTLNLPFIAQ